MITNTGIHQRTWNEEDALPHLVNESNWQRGRILRAGNAGLCLKSQPLMKIGNGYIPAAQDPTDPNTWRVPVIFT